MNNIYIEVISLTKVREGWGIGVGAINEVGECIASHICSSIKWAQRDMMESEWKHEIYQKHYPDGYQLIWVGITDEFRRDIPDWVLKEIGES